MKEGWEYKRFDEVFDLQMGKTPDRKNPHFFEGNNVWVSIRDMDGKEIIDSNEHISDEAIVASKIRIVKKGTVLMSFKLTVGKCAIAARDLYTNEAIMAFNQKEGYNVNPDFLYFYLLAYHWNGANKAVMGMTLNKATISQNRIGIPPLTEQERIISELDLLTSIINKQKAQLKELDSLAQSIFYDMFGDPIENPKGWEVKKLGEIATVKTGPFGSMLHKEDYISNGIPLINPIHMKDFQVVVDNDFTISESKAKELSNYILQKDDVIFARRGDIGRCAVISEKEKGYLCGTGSLFVRFICLIVPCYIMYTIRSDSFTKEIISRARGVTMLNLNSNIISDLLIPLPPLSLQQSFASKIEAIEAQKALITKSMEETQRLFDSRMDYWFA